MLGLRLMENDCSLGTLFLLGASINAHRLMDLLYTFRGRFRTTVANFISTFCAIYQNTYLISECPVFGSAPLVDSGGIGMLSAPTS